MELNLLDQFAWKKRQVKGLLLMTNLTFLLVVAASFQISARGIAQTITLNEKNVPLEKIFTAIEKQSGYHFVYNNKQLQMAKPVTIEVTHATLEQSLVICFKDQPLTYSILDNMVVIRAREIKSGQLLASLSGNDMLAGEIKGRITSDEGEALVGATIKIKGTGKVVTTNGDGRFILTGVDENASIEISYVGFI